MLIETKVFNVAIGTGKRRHIEPVSLIRKQDPEKSTTSFVTKELFSVGLRPGRAELIVISQAIKQAINLEGIRIKFSDIETIITQSASLLSYLEPSPDNEKQQIGIEFSTLPHSRKNLIPKNISSKNNF